MRTAYTDTNIQFTIEDVTFISVNIIFERFTRTIPSHSHGNNCYEIHFIPYGYGKVKVEDAYYDITPGTLYVTGPRVEHAQTPRPDDPMQEYCVYFKLRRSSHTKGSSPVMDAFTSMPFWLGKDTQGIMEIMTRLFAEFEQKPIGYLKQVELLLCQLVLAIVRNYEGKHSFRPVSHRVKGVDNKSRIIEEYFLYEYHSLSLNTLSERLTLSPRQTQRLLMDYYGKSFQEKKAEARMSAAAILLGDEARSISSIADALGYSSPEHFSNAFRKYYGTSPRDFRKNLPAGSQPF